MKVFLTGATGLVGANIALELLRNGYQVRLLVRNQQLAKDFFKQRGFELEDFVVADMLDKTSVQKGMSGCDAVIHAAAAVDLNAQNAEQTLHNNMEGVKSVVDGACELGIERVLHISSMTVFYNFDQPVLNEGSPLTVAHDGYTRSKLACENHVRQLQSEGKPVTIIYPSQVLGPDDPKLAQSNAALIELAGPVFPVTSSGVQFIDARDLAKSTRLLLEKPLNDKRTDEQYIVGGHYLSWQEFANRLARDGGLKVRPVTVPGAVLRSIGTLTDWLRNFISIEFPISKEAMTIVTKLPPAESFKLLADIDMQFREPSETIRDAVNELIEKGELSR